MDAWGDAYSACEGWFCILNRELDGLKPSSKSKALVVTPGGRRLALLAR